MGNCTTRSMEFRPTSPARVGPGERGLEVADLMVGDPVPTLQDLCIARLSPHPEQVLRDSGLSLNNFKSDLLHGRVIRHGYSEICFTVHFPSERGEGFGYMADEIRRLYCVIPDCGGHNLGRFSVRADGPFSPFVAHICEDVGAYSRTRWNETYYRLGVVTAIPLGRLGLSDVLAVATGEQTILTRVHRHAKGNYSKLMVRIRLIARCEVQFESPPDRSFSFPQPRHWERAEYARWIDFCQLSREELRALMQQMGASFLHDQRAAAKRRVRRVLSALE